MLGSLAWQPFSAASAFALSAGVTVPDDVEVLVLVVDPPGAAPPEGEVAVVEVVPVVELAELVAVVVTGGAVAVVVVVGGAVVEVGGVVVEVLWLLPPHPATIRARAAMSAPTVSLLMSSLLAGLLGLRPV